MNLLASFEVKQGIVWIVSLLSISASFLFFYYYFLSYLFTTTQLHKTNLHYSYITYLQYSYITNFQLLGQVYCFCFMLLLIKFVTLSNREKIAKMTVQFLKAPCN